MLFFAPFRKRSWKHNIFLRRKYALDLRSYLLGPEDQATAHTRPHCQLCVHSRSDGRDFIKLLIHVSEKNGRKCISDYLEVTHSGTI